jgi:hypothetical protein
MKITIESTDRIIELTDESGGAIGFARLWEGETESGIKVQCLVTRIAASSLEDLSQFEKELRETRAPQVYPQAFPLRMII